MSICKINSSKQFRQEVLNFDGIAIVVFPGEGSLISDFVQQQIEVVGGWRKDVKIASYCSSEKKNGKLNTGTLIAVYCDGEFVGATTKFCFAEHIDAWLEDLLNVFHSLDITDEHSNLI